MNERKQSDEWGTYISSKEAFKIMGSVTKKVIEDSRFLNHFFDVGINEKGYWNFNQIALQVEYFF